MTDRTAKPPLKLPSLPGLPTADNLLRALEMANKEPGRSVQLSWFSDTKNKPYTLSIVCSSLSASPDWQLVAGLVGRTEVIWSYSTGDVGLILNLINSECSDKTSTGEFAKFSFATPSHMSLWNTDSATAATSEHERSATATNRTTGLTLAGELKDIQIDGLLQSIALNRMTGRIAISSDVEAIDIFFDDGSPVHAAGLELSGDAAILEILTWKQGRFHFFPNERHSGVKSVRNKLEAILMQGATVSDHYAYLVKSGLSMESFLLRKAPLSEEQFETKVKGALPLDMPSQKNVYRAIDDKSTLLDLLRKQPMPKSQWVPILHNLLTCELIVISDRPSQAAKRSGVEAIELNPKSVEQALDSLLVPGTRMMTYGMFLYFLSIEYDRYQQTRLPFSLLVFEAMVKGPNGMMPLSMGSVVEMARLINSLKRSFDVLAQHRALECALLLPYTDVAGAALFAKQMLVRMLNTQFSDLQTPGAELKMFTGIAAIPDDCKDLPTLIGAATEAKKLSYQRGEPIVTFRDLYR